MSCFEASAILRVPLFDSRIPPQTVFASACINFSVRLVVAAYPPKIFVFGAGADSLLFGFLSISRTFEVKAPMIQAGTGVS